MANPLQATINYIKSSIAELKKVTWPTKDMTIRYSMLVIAVSIGVALFFAGLDYVFSKLITETISYANTPAAIVEEPVTPDLEPTVLEGNGSEGGDIINLETGDGESIQVETSDSADIDLQPLE